MSDEAPVVAAPAPAEAPAVSARDQAIAALRDMAPEGTVADDADPNAGIKPSPEQKKKPAKAEVDEAVEVAATPETELKAKLRAKNAAFEAREKALADRQAQMESEHNGRLEAFNQDRQKFTKAIADLQQMAKDNPSKFLETTGIDLTGLVRGKLQEGKPEAVVDRLQRELQEMKAERQAEREQAQKANAEQAQAQSRQAQEKDFLDLAKPESAPLLHRMSKKNQSLAMQNAYLISGVMQRENGGKLPQMDQLVKRVEAELRSALEDDDEEAAPAVAAPKSKLSPKAAAAPTPGKAPHEMTDAERRKEAMRVLGEIQRASARDS